MTSDENNKDDIKIIIESQAERNRFEKKRRKEVFDAISTLIDPVSTDVLINYLNILDYASWNEIIEERFLSRLCGYPICKNQIKVDFSKKYVLDQHRKLIYETNHELNKFCSNICLGLSMGLQSQLHKDPLWVTGYREPKIYNIKIDHNKFLPNVINKSKTAVKLIESSKNVSDVLVRLEKLKIVEREDSDSDEESEENNLDEREEQSFERAIKEKKQKKS